MSNALLRRAIRNGLRTYGIAGMSTFIGMGFCAAASAQDDSAGQKLDTITVTGSNIRRVDIETSNPIITIDRAEIQKSGKQTVGDLVQQLPTIAGNANNPNVNNGGGTGGSFVSLRGLGTNRTLVLVNGKRTITGDVNAISAAAIERIEVLTDGASAVYGSDAIAGVVNFILRKDYQGAELQANYGVSDRDDGARRGFAITFGQTSDKGSVLAGIEYNKADQILAGHREFGKYALTYGSDVPGGSNSVPGGRFLAGLPEFASCASGEGTFDPAAPGGDGIPPGFRCFFPVGFDPSHNDGYNYAPINLITTPQERGNLFLNGSYKISDSVEAYMEVFHNTTRSAAQLAPLPISFAASGLVVTADNPYNPFGQDIGLGGAVNYAVRMTALGPRISKNNNATDQARVGLKGNLFDSSWGYDLWANYGHIMYRNENINYLNAAALKTALSGDCELPQEGVPLSTETCLNVFNQYDPTTAELLQRFYSLGIDKGGLQVERQGGLDVNGTLFDLPAGSIGLAAGANYRKYYTRSHADTVAIADPSTGFCDAGSQSLCTNIYSGTYDVKEVYAEMFVPILKDLPFVHSLNVTLGDRWSKYSLFGSTNNWKVAVEYRPIEDLLLRGTVSKVFRSPNPVEAYFGRATSYDNYTPNPALNEPDSADDPQVQTAFSGALTGGYPIQPETGKSFDFGVVYDPQWLPGLSVSADVWRIYLLNNILRPTGQTIIDQCYKTGQFVASDPWCGFIHFSGNLISNISGVTWINLGRFDADGVDFAATYKLPETAFGRFVLGLQATYTARYDNALFVDEVQHVAGTFDSQFGNIARWRALGSVAWQMGDFSASWQMRYVGHLKDGDGAFAGLPGGYLPIGAVTYHNVSFGYNIEPINTRIDVGIDNVGDKQPPLFYESGVNANIDINTYDPIGRYYWGRVTVRF